MQGRGCHVEVETLPRYIARAACFTAATLFIGLVASTLASTISGSTRHTPADEFDEFECQAEAITST